MTKFVVYEKVAEFAWTKFDKENMSSLGQTGVNLGSGLMAGFAAAIVSQPADTMLSKISKTKGLPGQGITSRLIGISKELGLRGNFSGIGARLFMVGGLTAGQFAIYGDLKKVSSSITVSSCYSDKNLGIGRHWRCRDRKVKSLRDHVKRTPLAFLWAAFLWRYLLDSPPPPSLALGCTTGDEGLDFDVIAPVEYQSSLATSIHQHFNFIRCSVRNHRTYYSAGYTVGSCTIQRSSEALSISSNLKWSQSHRRGLRNVNVHVVHHKNWTLVRGRHDFSSQDWKVAS